MFIWTISDVVGLVGIAIGLLVFGAVYAQDWWLRRSKLRRRLPDAAEH